MVTKVINAFSRNGWSIQFTKKAPCEIGDAFFLSIDGWNIENYSSLHTHRP